MRIRFVTRWFVRSWSYAHSRMASANILITSLRVREDIRLHKIEGLFSIFLPFFHLWEVTSVTLWNHSSSLVVTTLLQRAGVFYCSALLYVMER